MRLSCTRDFVPAGPWRSLLCLLLAAALLPAGSARAAEPPVNPEAWYVEDEGASLLLRLEETRAPELVVPDANWLGAPQSLRALRGSIVVLDFWAAWCPHCWPCLSRDQDLVKKHGKEGVVVVGIHDGSPAGRTHWEAAKGSVRERSVTFPIALDSPDLAGNTNAKYHIGWFPTYVVIDREGIVRGAGIRPEYVETLVEKLLKKGGETGGRVEEFPADMYLGGESRPDSLRALEGKPAPALQPADWQGTPCTIRPGGGVTVVQFYLPGSPASLSATRLAAIRKIRGAMGERGAAFVLVASSGSDWTRLKEQAQKEGWDFPVMLDSAPVQSGGALRVGAKGKTFDAYSAHSVLPTVVIDGKGIVRAAGVTTAAVLGVVDHVVAHPEPSLYSAPRAVPGGAAK